jgi:GT2 family glycosyltransferase
VSHTPRVSYVVLSRNSAAYIERCLRSLDVQNVLPGGDEIWVVDNGSTDGTGEVLARFAGTRPWVHTIALDRNYGTTRSRNLAVARARGGYIAFVDSDAELPAGTIDRLIATASQSARAGIVAPRLNYPDGRLQKSVDVFPTIARKIQRRLALRQMEAAERPRAGVVEVDYAIAACWLMPRDAVDAVGPLDEAIFYAPEDVDYCIRMWAAGYRVLYDSDAIAIHHAQEISRTLIPRRAAFSHAAGLVYLFRKHRYGFGRARLYRRINRLRGSAPVGALANFSEGEPAPVERARRIT